MASLHESIVQEDKIKTFRSPTQKRQGRIAVIVVSVVLALAAGGYFFLTPREEIYHLREYDTAVVQKGDLAQITQASGTVTIPATLSVLSPETGYAAVLAVQEGETVTENQLLARFDVPDLEDELEDLGADLEVKERNLASTIEEDRFALKRLEQSLKYAEEDILGAEEEVARMKQLVGINASRLSELEAAEDELRKGRTGSGYRGAKDPLGAVTRKPARFHRAGSYRDPAASAAHRRSEHPQPDGW